MKNILLLLLIVPFFGFSQISGTIIDKESKDPVYGAKIIASNGQKILSDFDGKFNLNPDAYPIQLIISAQTYLTDTISVEEAGD